MAIDLLNGLIDILWLIWCHVGADVVSVYLKAADLRQNIFIFTKPLTPKIPFSFNKVIESDGEILPFEKCLESNVIILIWMPSSVFIFTFLRDITAMLPIFYLHVLRKNLEWNYCGHTGMECYKITMCVCLDLFYEKSEAAVFYFFHLWKKQTNKQKQENIWNHNSVLRVFRLHWPSVSFCRYEKKKKKVPLHFLHLCFWRWLLFSVCETTLNTWSDTVSVYTDNQVFNTCYWYVYADTFITFYGLHSSSSTLKVWKLVASGANTPFTFEIVHWNMEKNWGFI